jgi:hypothetical protein
LPAGACLGTGSPGGPTRQKLYSLTTGFAEIRRAKLGNYLRPRASLLGFQIRRVPVFGSRQTGLSHGACRLRPARQVPFFLPSPLFSARRRLCRVPDVYCSSKSALPAGFGPSTLRREVYSANSMPSVKRLSPSFSSTRQIQKFQ